MKLLLLVLAAVAVATVWIYNRLINSRNRVDAAWSDIDVQLQRRHDLIPRLVAAVDQYGDYERATLEAVTELRASAIKATSIGARGELEEMLGERVGKIIALAENYPDLKANENFLQLQEELVTTEDYLQFARRYYNGSVRDYNTLAESFPSNLVANLFAFEAREFFQRSADEVADVPLIEMSPPE